MHVGIVGAGLAGLTAAHWLRAGGAEVGVFERRDGPGQAARFGLGRLAGGIFFRLAAGAQADEAAAREEGQQADRRQRHQGRDEEQLGGVGEHGRLPGRFSR
jgi:2-polyprenyl-6-methoxyphenol hydroxylase-like FAD-dependent oxidoreductase